MSRHLRVIIDLDAIKNNLNTLRKRLSPEIKIIGVVKANAYGHGALEVSKVLENSGIDMLATAYLEEAIALREAGIRAPIIVLFDEPDPQKFLRYDLSAVLHNRGTLDTLSRILKPSSPPLSVHIKIDTGMGRLGFGPEEIPSLMRKLKEINSLKIEGIMSHFSEAELSNKDSARRQIEIFKNVLSEIKEEFGALPLCHMANSAASVNLPEARFSAVRPGLMLYGYLPGLLEERELKPAMKVTTEILNIREVPAGTPVSYGGTFITKRKSLIGIISAGYADGLMRSLSNRGYVLYMGKRAPVIGRICMDLTMIDLTEIIKSEKRQCKEVILLGSEERESISAKDIASLAGTIPYEVLTTFGGLGKKEFLKND
ncbi:MAG: alanine racemase [Thermodesulfovibrionales bacterium]